MRPVTPDKQEFERSEIITSGHVLPLQSMIVAIGSHPSSGDLPYAMAPALIPRYWTHRLIPVGTSLCALGKFLVSIASFFDYHLPHVGFKRVRSLSLFAGLIW